MKCKHCAKGLSVEIGSRPVQLCRHLLCDVCAGELKCPMCGTEVDGDLDQYIDEELLRDLTEFKNAQEKISQTSSMYFSCQEHPNKQIQFICSKESSYLCGECAWSHMQSHKIYVVPYDEQNFNSDLSEMKAAFENFNNEMMTVGKYLASITSSKPGSKEFNEILASARKIVLQLDTKQLKLCHPDFQRRQIAPIAATIGALMIRPIPAYKATRDGQEISKFKELCANKGPSVLVVTAANGVQFGAFLKNSWRSDNGESPGDTMDFIFSVEPELKLPCFKKTGQGSGCGCFLRVGDDIIICQNFLNVEGSYVSPGNNYGNLRKSIDEFSQLLGGKFRVCELEVYII